MKFLLKRWKFELHSFKHEVSICSQALRRERDGSCQERKVGGNDAVTKFTAYVSPYFVVSNGGAYTKHIYAASQRIASKLGNVDGFGADPTRVGKPTVKYV